MGWRWPPPCQHGTRYTYHHHACMPLCVSLPRAEAEPPQGGDHIWAADARNDCMHACCDGRRPRLCRPPLCAVVRGPGHAACAPAQLTTSNGPYAIPAEASGNLCCLLPSSSAGGRPAGVCYVCVRAATEDVCMALAHTAALLPSDAAVRRRREGEGNLWQSCACAFGVLLHNKPRATSQSPPWFGGGNGAGADGSPSPRPSGWR